MIPEAQKVSNGILSLEEFMELNKTEDRLEYIDGSVYALASPSVEHQRVLLKLSAAFYSYFKGKSCEPFISPLDVWLKNEQKLSTQKVQPDLMVICDKSGLDEHGYTGVPTLIIEIVSPSNYQHDRLKKYNLYMAFGVKEYWLVNLKSKTIDIYVLSGSTYVPIGAYAENGNAQSHNFEGLSVDLQDVFA